MNFYELNGQSYALIDGQLYVRAQAVEHAERPEGMPDPAADVPAPTKRGRKPKIDEDTGERPKSKRLGPQAKQAILEEFEAGANKKELAEKYGIHPTTIDYIKKHTKPASSPGRVVTNYQCMKGHRFQSTLEQSKAICPNCREKVFRKIEDKVVEGGVLDQYDN